jgi:AcrR family transcriptional regulator
LKKLTLSELIARSGVPASSIHHYRRKGLIPPPERVAPNRFAYDERHVAALHAIRARSAAAPPEYRDRIVAAAIEAFKTRSYSEVTVSDIADGARMAKGNVYRYFHSKEDLLTAAIETLLEETDRRFHAAVDALGGPDGLRDDPEKTILMFGYLVADVLPMLLELGARAAKGHEPSADLARKVLRTLAETAGRPFTGPDVAVDEAINAGLKLIEDAFAIVLAWSVGPDWPPDHIPAGTNIPPL